MTPGPFASVALVAALALSASGASAAVSEQLEQARAISRGRALATAHCGLCHAVGESGRSPNVLAPPFRSLHTAYPVGDVIDAITQGAPTGHPAMPQFRFSFEQGRDLVAYVRSIQEPAPPAAPRPD
jgi:mono/diheme cytochrome c family protein